MFAEKGQNMRVGLRKHGWHEKVFLEEDGSIVSSMSDTKCTQRNMAFMNMHTMVVETGKKVFGQSTKPQKVSF